MNIKIITVGKLKEKYLRDGVQEYVKRLGAYAHVELIEVPDEKIPNNPSLAEETLVKSKEGRKILDHVKQNDFMILLSWGCSLARKAAMQTCSDWMERRDRKSVV